MKRIVPFLGVVLMYLMIVFPAKLYVIKIPLLIFLFIMQFKKVKVSPPVRMLVGLLCFSTIWALVIGVLKNTPNPMAEITVGLLWPIASLFIILPLLQCKTDFESFTKYLFWGHSFVVLYDVAFVLSVIVGFNMINIYPEVEVPFSFYGVTSRLNFDDNLNFITYTTPLFLFIWLAHYDIKVNRTIQTIILLLNIFLLIVSGRRSLMLTFFLAPVLVVIFRGVFPHNVVKNVRISFVFFILIVVGAVSYFYLNEPEVFEGYLTTFTKAFDSEDEPTRFRQASMLWQHFSDNFLFGEGAGVELYKENIGKMASRFELSYLHKFTIGGIFGGIFYLLGTVGVFLYSFKLAKKRKETLLLFFSIAFLFSLIAHATNPILSAFDSMLPLFAGYAQINCLYFYKNYNS